MFFVLRSRIGKGYRFFEKSFPNFAPDSVKESITQIPGVLEAGYYPAPAEIKPVEPEQDNACAGKVRASLLSFPVFVNPAFHVSLEV